MYDDPMLSIDYYPLSLSANLGFFVNYYIANNNMSDTADIPDSMSGLRACLGCSLVKTFRQFTEDGCENCRFLEMDDAPQRVHECTTSYFEGVIAMVEPNGSWVGRWQQLSSFLPGMYAVQVVGELPKEDIEMCKREGLHYRASAAATK